MRVVVFVLIHASSRNVSIAGAHPDDDVSRPVHLYNHINMAREFQKILEHNMSAICVLSRIHQRRDKNKNINLCNIWGGCCAYLEPRASHFRTLVHRTVVVKVGGPTVRSSIRHDALPEIKEETRLDWGSLPHRLGPVHPGHAGIILRILFIGSFT